MRCDFMKFCAENAATAEQPKPEQEKEGVDIDIKSEDGVQNGKVPEAEEKDFDSLVAKLDMFLVYLWRVHGVDYYGGEELSDPSDYEGHTNLRRTIRGPRPEEGEQATDEEGKLPILESPRTPTTLLYLEEGPGVIVHLVGTGGNKGACIKLAFGEAPFGGKCRQTAKT